MAGEQLQLVRRTIRCIYCNGVFDHVRQYVAHFKHIDGASECEQRQRGAT